MALRIESSVDIARPVEEVFPFFLDLEKAAASDPTVESVVKTPEGPIGVGTEYTIRQRPPAVARLLGRRPETSMVYTRIEPNREFEFDAELGPLAPHMRIGFERREGGTRVTVRGGGQPKGPFRLLSGPLQRVGQRVWEQRLARIKATLEASEPAPGGTG